MIRGCLAWQANGLAPAETVLAATASYFDNQDLFAQWLEEKCDAEPGNEHKTSTSAKLFKSWSDYAKAAGDPPGTRKSFARILARLKSIRTERQEPEPVSGEASSGLALKPTDSSSRAPD
jgi:putative DNA primase/helicase